MAVVPARFGCSTFVPPSPGTTGSTQRVLSAWQAECESDDG